ncbi:MAG: PDZ domain-containing protein [Phycisphaerales bacterium]
MLLAAVISLGIAMLATRTTMAQARQPDEVIPIELDLDATFEVRVDADGQLSVVGRRLRVERPDRDDDPSIPPALREEFGRQLNALADDRYQVRTAAAEWFREVSVPNAVFEAMLRADYLTLEQGAQLLAVLRRRVLERPSGALGVQMIQATDLRGVIINELLPRMPAAEVLKRGDRVTHVEGVEIYSQAQFSMLIAAYRPGETVRLVVERMLQSDPDAEAPDLRPAMSMETVEVDITLADDSGLGDDVVMRNQQERRIEAAGVVQEFSNQPIILEVTGEVQQFDAATDPTIIELKRQLDQFVETDNARMRQTLLRSWEVQRDLLLRQANQPGLDASERERRRSLFEAYQNLLSGVL